MRRRLSPGDRTVGHVSSSSARTYPARGIWFPHFQTIPANPQSTDGHPLFCLLKKSLSRLGERHMINLYFGSIFVYIPLSVPWLRTTRIIIFRRCRDKRFMFLSFLCNKDSDEFFLIPNVFSVFYIESSKCIILYKWKRLCISR